MPDKEFDLDGFPSWINEVWLKYWDISQSYRRAIELHFLEHVKEISVYSERDILPTLFLIRHFIELTLKSFLIKEAQQTDGQFIKEIKGHNLSFTLDKLHTINPNIRLKSNVESFIRKLGKFDEKGDIFKYPINIESKEFFKNIKNEFPEISRLSSIVVLTRECFSEFDRIIKSYEPFLDLQSKSNIS